MDRVLLSYGNGGLENQQLIQVFLKHFDNPYGFEDAGLINDENLVISTDSFIISPIFFPGGDIGKLSVCGSCNDVAMMGAKPKYLSASFIIEEGFKITDLDKIAESIGKEIKNNDITLLSADTKVVPKLGGEIPNIFINTTALGKLEFSGISAKNLQDKDVIIVSGNIGTHGACIYCLRNNISLQSSLQSDCSSLWSLVESLKGITIRSMRDATRGGLASVLNEWANTSKCEIVIKEDSIPVLDEVRGVCEILGLEAYSLANEGVCVISLPSSEAKEALKRLHSHPLGKNATIIGEVVKNKGIENRVILQTSYGSKRYLDYPQGEILPRIC